MKGKSVLLLVIALVCGAIASVGLTQMLSNSPGGSAKVPMMKVYVTKKGVDINEELTADSIRLEEWPKDRVPEGAITKLENVEGKFAMFRLIKGQPIIRKMISSKRIGTEEKIPEGYRAVAVRTSAQSAVSNLLLPGTRVDVILFVKAGNGIPRTQTRTILKDVRVFSVNTLTTRESGETGKSKESINAKTVTLLVEPSQVQLLMLATQIGNIQFAMRKPDDISDDETEPTTTRELLGDDNNFGTPRNQRSTAPEESESGEPSDLQSFLAGLATPSPTMPVSTKPVGEMVVIDGNHSPRKFQWVEGDDLPREVTFGGNAGSLPSMPPGLTIPGLTPAPLNGPASEQPGSELPESSSDDDENAEGEEREV